MCRYVKGLMSDAGLELRRDTRRNRTGSLGCLDAVTSDYSTVGFRFDSCGPSGARREDLMGNIFGRWEGSDPEAAVSSAPCAPALCSQRSS